MYDLPSMENVSKVVLDEQVVEGECDPYIIYETSEKQRQQDLMLAQRLASGD